MHLPGPVAPLLLLFQLLSVTSADQFDVLSYNVFMRPFFHDGQTIRANHLIDMISGYDAIVLQEAFDDRVRTLLRAGLQAEYPYSTGILGEDAGLGQDGGVIILSKWPIVREDQRAFAGRPAVG